MLGTRSKTFNKIASYNPIFNTAFTGSLWRGILNGGRLEVILEGREEVAYDGNTPCLTQEPLASTAT